MYKILVTIDLKNEKQAKEHIPACVNIGEVCEIKDWNNNKFIIKK